MPTYTFYNKDTDEQFDEFMSWSEREKYLKDNPHIEPMLTTAALVGDHIVNRMDGGMKETFSRIAEAHPNSPLADRFGSSQNNKQKKVQEIGKKHGLVRKDGGQNMSKVKLQIDNKYYCADFNLIHGEFAQGGASWVGFPHNKMGLLWQRKISQIQTQ